MKKQLRRGRVAGLVLLAGMVAASRAHAQGIGFVSALFKDVHSVTLFAEFAEIGDSPQLETATSQCVGRGLCGGGAEILFDLSPTGRGLHLELGLGASYLRGFGSRPLADVFDLRGSIRAFPTFGAYVSSDAVLGYLSVYVGGNLGLAELWNAQVYDAGRKQISLKGQTFEYGPCLGVALPLLGLTPFVEGSYRARRFPSIEYGTTEPLPASWPHELDLSGWQLELGVQFGLGGRTSGPIGTSSLRHSGTPRLTGR